MGFVPMQKDLFDMQIDMFALFDPEPKRPAFAGYVAPKRREVTLRGVTVTVSEGDPEPFLIEVRGMEAIVTGGMGFATHTTSKPGSLFWSSTGYRSMTTTAGRDSDGAWSADAARRVIEDFIDAPRKNGNGLGGKLEVWWPSYVTQWQSSVRTQIEEDRAEYWAHFGPEKHAAAWAALDARVIESLARMRAEGIDPNEVGAPSYRNKKITWPTF